MDISETNSASGKRRPHTRKRGAPASAGRNGVEAAPLPKAASAPDENAIREGRKRASASSKTPGGGGQATLALETRAERDAPQELKVATSVPSEMERRFVRVGREFYFPDGTR